MPDSEDDPSRFFSQTAADIGRHASFDSPRERLVILGAGASVEAGVPTGPALHDIFFARADLPLYKTVATRLGTNPPDVERYFRALDYLADRPTQDTLASDIEKVERYRNRQPLAGNPQAELSIIRSLLREHLWLRYNLPSVLMEETGPADYLRPLARASIGTTVMTLNYDNTFEIAAGAAVQTLDPRGGNRVLVPGESRRRARLLKLHGSLDWRQMDDDVFKGGNPTGTVQYDPAIIFGSGNKLRHYGPFLDLMHAFKEVLLRSPYVITVGYGFRDDHVNEAIRTWASIKPDDGVKVLDICSGLDGKTYPSIVKGLLAHGHMEVNLHAEDASSYIARNFNAAPVKPIGSVSE